MSWQICSALASLGLFGVAAEPPLSPFGVGSCYINNRSAEDHARWLPQMAAIGLRVNRTPHLDWGALETKPGAWHWTTLDEQMRGMERHGFAFGGTLMGSPDWNDRDRPGHLPVNNLEGWSKYVTAVVKHTKGKIRRFEIWNEPPNFTGPKQTPADYAKLVDAAYRAAKAVDPEVRIGLAAKSAHVNYLEQVIRAGAKDRFDFITLHPYEVLDGIAEDAGSESVFLHIVPTLRKMLAVQNPAKANVPVIYTELGVDSGKGADVQARALVKAYVLGIAGGVECIQWFEGRDGDSGPLGLLDGAGKPRPAYHALANMIRLFGQHPKLLGWQHPNGRAWTFAFAGANGPVVAAWAPNGSREPIDFGTDVRVVDPISGKENATRSTKLGHTPIFVTGVSQAWLDAAKANLGKPYPWGGDYSNAREVSVEYTPEPTEKGLHTRAGSKVAKAVVAYGGSGRAGDVPGGAAFIVDPNFLSYDPTPIEIEVEVRRLPENRNAGFKLVYESTDGFKTAGHWYTVPDNARWHTVKWRIDDPQFVNYWGYNFTLESDGDVYNKYAIRRAVVRKVK